MVIQNAIKILEKPEKFIISSNRHDFIEHVFKDGATIFIDGGCSLRDGGYYIRRGGSALGREGIKWEDWSITDEDNFARIKARLLWGTFGKSGNETLEFVCLKDCETEHLIKILENQSPSALHCKVILSILKCRKNLFIL